MNTSNQSALRHLLIQAIAAVLTLTFLLVVGSDALRSLLIAGLICLLALYMVVFLHELGHYLAGMRVGYRFAIFSVGPVYVQSQDGKMVTGLHPFQWPPSEILGFTVFFVEDFADFRLRMLLYVAGGPLATALTVALAGFLYAVGNQFPNFGLYYTQPITWALGIFTFGLMMASVSLLVGSLYPANWVPTDGNKLFRLLRSEASAERLKAQIMVAQANLHGIRPRDWNRDWITAMTALDEPSVDTVQAYMQAYRWGLDSGDEHLAESFLTIAVKHRQQAAPNERVTVLLEAAFFEMRYHANPQHAIQWLSKLENQQNRARATIVMRMACARDLTRRQYDKARQRAYQAIDMLDSANAFDGRSIMERDLFRDMIKLCDLADEMQSKRAN